MILIVGGGLTYSYPSLSSSGVFISLFLIVIFFIVICLKTKQDTQLKVAKFLTFVFAVIMSIAIVGIILKVREFSFVFPSHRLEHRIHILQVFEKVIVKFYHSFL